MDVLERVGSSRMMLDGKFPYPSAVDCMRYAIQEMAEMDDAMMRQEQPEHKRNNGREHDPRKELGQAGFMLLSAALYLENTYPTDDKEVDAHVSTVELWANCIDSACMAVKDFSLNLVSYASVDISYALAYWKHIASSHGWDVAELIEDTCADFERKHLEPVGPDMRHGGHTA